MHSPQLVKCTKLRMRVSITVYRVRNGPAPVDFLACYWLSAAVAGL